MSRESIVVAPASTAADRPGRRRRRIRRAAGRLLAAGFLLLVATELGARFIVGLGDPPLYVRDPEIEYLFKPSSSYRYFHNDIRINSHSMRAAEFPAKKADPSELRVMVIGDSIVAGGGRVVQADLATERLAASLSKRLGRVVNVGNISAASWGAPNQLAYVRRFGLMDADIVLLVLNSGDADDVPGLEAIGAAYPEGKPLLALQEPGRRALQRFAPGLCQRLGLLTPADRGPDGAFRLGYEQRCEKVEAALRELVALARSAGATVGAVQYWTLRELRTGPDAGHDRLLATLSANGVRTWQTNDHAGASLAAAGDSPDAALFLSNDEVHPSAAGHARLGAVLEEAVVGLLRAGGASGTPENAPGE